MIVSYSAYSRVGTAQHLETHTYGGVRTTSNRETTTPPAGTERVTPSMSERARAAGQGGMDVDQSNLRWVRRIGTLGRKRFNVGDAPIHAPCSHALLTVPGYRERLGGPR